MLACIQSCVACSVDEASTRAPHAAVVPDSHYQWISPDERIQRPFSRERGAALDLAAEYDLCISGNGLTHLHSIGVDTSYVPLAQVGAELTSFPAASLLRALGYG